MIFYYILMIISLLGLLITGFQGFFNFKIYNANHISFAFISTIFYMFTQTFIMFYFIGAGKKIKETIINHDLNKSTYQEVIDIKRMLFKPLTMNMLYVGTAFIIGGGVHTGAIHKYWHSALFVLSIIHYIKVILIQKESFYKNSSILLKVGKELEHKSNQK